MSYFLSYISIPHSDLDDQIIEFRTLKLLLSFALKHGDMERERRLLACGPWLLPFSSHP